ncbi:hypothetical protein N7509_002339 [Penicillium cosmopolitanum]|uniref:Uncharacterized protein n=1 Tax=Penicillium cosmopolitanum TaxID=1131564 RepID=A0A9W9W8M9_9EURO|nr:uncharacterized protein N7509_002339 [Penicillium cosmopolitanum]KAJ5408456.1 hypothetical protein N7509_002339 [Penicillium cosmopolitanum]
MAVELRKFILRPVLRISGTQNANAGEGGGGAARNSGETASVDESHVHPPTVAKANNIPNC